MQSRIVATVGKMILTGWFLVNIVGPILLPVIGILPLRLLPIGPAAASVRIMATVKDGQLCWAVIAMGASTIYELWQATEAHLTLPAWSGLALAGSVMLMLPAMIVAAGGAVFSTPLLASMPVGGARAWAVHYRVFVGSAAMVAAAAFTYANVHFSLPPLSSWR